MDWDFIIQCILAVGLSVTLLALLDSRIKLRAERKKTSMFYGISKNLEGDTWKQKDTIDVQQGTIKMQQGTIEAQQGTIKVQNGTILEQKQEIESLEADLRESRAMAEMLMQRSSANAHAGTRSNTRTDTLTQRLLMLSDELANICYESSSRPETMGRRIEQTLHAGLTGHEALEQIDSLIEASYPGFLGDLHSAFPWMTEDDRLLVSLMCCGITPNAVSIILGMDLNRLNKWKTRLAKQMDSPVRLSKFLNEKLLAYCNGSQPAS